MAELVSTLNSKISSNNTAIGFLEPEIEKAQDEIDLYDPYVTKVDGEAIVILNQINDLKGQIVSLSTNAYAVGCGTTVGMSTVYPDTINVTVENIETASYTGDDPFGHSTTQLSISNIGIGSVMISVADNTLQSGIGTLYGGIGSCFSPGFGNCLTDSDCTGYASSITALQNQITSLRNQLPTLITNSNALKKERRNSQISRYGQERSVKSLNDRNTEMKATINVIEGL